MNGRTDKSLRNIRASLVLYFVKFALPIITKTMFIKVLGEVYLGVNATFVNIITLFSVSELGISTAIGYQLYKPLAHNDEVSISRLMNEMRKLYHRVAAIVFALGVAFLPALNYIMDVKVENMYLTYFLYVVNSAASYLCSYKHILINADQKAYVKTRVKTMGMLVLNLLQLLVLWITKDFLLYVFVAIMVTIAENLIVSHKVDKEYGFLKDNSQLKLEKGPRKELYQNIKFLLKNRIGLQLINASDGIIILLVGGVVTTGIYSNYVYIIGIFSGLIITAVDSFGASVGNLVAKENNEKKLSMFYDVNFLIFALVAYCTCMISSLINPFILLWIGPKFTFDSLLITLLLINFFISIIRQPIVLFKDAMGLFYYDRNRTIITAVLNIALSSFLGKFMGINGVVLGTTISMIMITSWFEPFILFKHGYKESIKQYVRKMLGYIIFTVLMALIFNWFVNSYFTDITIIKWLVAAVVLTIAFLIAFCLVFGKTTEFSYFANLLKNRIKILRRGRKND